MSVLPAIVTLSKGEQMAWSGACIGQGLFGWFTMMLTVSIVSPFAQGPLLTVHVNTFTPATGR